MWPNENCIRVVHVSVHSWTTDMEKFPDERGYEWIEDVKSVEVPSDDVAKKLKLSDLFDMTMATWTVAKNEFHLGIKFNRFRPREYAMFDVLRCTKQTAQPSHAIGRIFYYKHK